MKQRDVIMTPRVTLKSPFIENISKTMCIIRDTTSETRCFILFHQWLRPSAEDMAQ